MFTIDELNPIGALDTDINTYIANQALLKLNNNYDKMLEISSLTQSDYVCRMLVVPSATVTLIGYQVVQETLNIDPFSFLLGMSASSNQPEGLSYTVMDKGNNMYLTPNRNLNSLNTTGRFIFSDDVASPTGWLLSPVAVSSKGQIQVNLTNLSSATAIAQLCLKFAVPVNKKNQQQVSVKGGI